MKKNKLLISLFMVFSLYIIFLIDLNTNSKILYPITILKDILSYPLRVKASEEITIDDETNREELQKEITELKKLLNLNQNIAQYEVINATTTSRNKTYWFNTITIDKGTKSGIEKDMIVVTHDGLIGKIDSVTSITSVVKLITNNDINNKISVSVNGTNGLIDGYIVKENLLTMTALNKFIDIKSGDKVITTGMGGIFPSGISVGIVSSIEVDEYDVGKIIKITPSVDLSNIRFVAVLKRKTP